MCEELLHSLSDDEKSLAKRLIYAGKNEYNKGDTVISLLSRIDAFGMVLSGSVQAYTFTKDGTPVLLSVVEEKRYFGMSLYIMQKPSPVEVISAGKTSVQWYSISKLSELKNDVQNVIYKNMLSILAYDVQNMNKRIRILTKPDIRRKVLSLLSMYEIKAGEKFSIPMDRSAMAAYIGTDRSALSRELSNMKKDGIIEYYRNTFIIL
jgi:CRP-like cAMP-binding protein